MKNVLMALALVLCATDASASDHFLNADGEPTGKRIRYINCDWDAPVDDVIAYLRHLCSTWQPGDIVECSPGTDGDLSLLQYVFDNHCPQEA